MIHEDPVQTLIVRTKGELAAEFDSSRPMRISRAPGRLDIMGGIADYSGSLAIQATLKNGTAVALQPRGDRYLQIFSFNLLDEHLPFTFAMPLDSLARFSIEQLRSEFSQAGRQWAASLAGCLAALHTASLIDLEDTKFPGMNLAVYSTLPERAGLGSSAATTAATMMNLIEHAELRPRVDPLRVAALCQGVQNDFAGFDAGIVPSIAICMGQSDALIQIDCQPHEVMSPLPLPRGVRILGIDSGVKHPIHSIPYQKTRCAAFMGHQIILNKMREIGLAMGRPLWGDPMHGYLARLDPEDYKKIFRPALPENMSGQQFLDKYAETIDRQTSVSPIEWYQVQHACDHHVLEARRVRKFAEFLKEACESDGPPQKLLLDKAGHLMYASHLSYSNDAMLGSEECDVLVKLIRQHEHRGFYGARVTAAGSGGSLAVLADEGESADAALAELASEYEKTTNRKAQILHHGSAGAWNTATMLI